MMEHGPIAEMVRNRFGSFIDTRINPTAYERDQTISTFPPEVMREAARIGLVGFTAPKELGGGGNSWEVWGHALEEIGYLSEDAGLCMVLAYRESAANLVYRSGRQDLIDKYVRPAITGDGFIGWAYSEGADPFSFTTTVHRADGHYVFNGEKQAVTGALGDRVFITYGVNETKDDIVAVMVERDDPGVVLKPLPTMGLRSLGLARLYLNEVKVPEDRVLVPSDGVSHAQIFINERRITGTCWVLGRMRALFEKVVSHLDQRFRYKQPLTEMQTIQAALGRMHVAIESSKLFMRTMLSETGREDLDYLWDPWAAKSKYFLLEQATMVAQTVQQIVGGYGYMQEYEFDRFLRDFYGLVPIVGTQFTLEVDIGIRAIQEVRKNQRATAQAMEAAK
ncbi:MAG: acyl-CoA dehydrogenase family protein [Candidatus Methylomirabilales bacterium]